MCPLVLDLLHIFVENNQKALFEKIKKDSNIFWSCLEIVDIYGQSFLNCKLWYKENSLQKPSCRRSRVNRNPSAYNLTAILKQLLSSQVQGLKVHCNLSMPEIKTIFDIILET